MSDVPKPCDTAALRDLLKSFDGGAKVPVYVRDLRKICDELDALRAGMTAAPHCEGEANLIPPQQDGR